MATSKQDVLCCYHDRLTTHQRSLKQLLRSARLIRYARAAAGVCIPAILWLAFGVHIVWIWFVFLPAIIYITLYWHHERVYQSLIRASRAVTYYLRGIDRVEDRWIGTGTTDTTFVEPGHTY